VIAAIVGQSKDGRFAGGGCAGLVTVIPPGSFLHCDEGMTKKRGGAGAGQAFQPDGQNEESGWKA
jgi:hypothetical protein